MCYTAVQIFLEELKDLYGIDWGTTLIDIRTNEQKKDWFLKLDPNGKSNLRTAMSKVSDTDCIV